MKTKNEYLKEQGIDLEKELGVSTYTKVRFAMEAFAKDYAQEQVKNCSIPDVVRSVFTIHSTEDEGIIKIVGTEDDGLPF